MSTAGKPNTPSQPTRPHMPNYGISTQEKGLMTWNWVDEQMTKSRNYWVCSTRPDGRPHTAPVWGIWVEGHFYFSSARSSRRVRNFTHNPEIVVHLESGDDTVILEGKVEEVKDTALVTRLSDIYKAKYPPYTLDIANEPGNGCYVFKPHTAFAWLESDYSNTPTRWTFA